MALRTAQGAAASAPLARTGLGKDSVPPGSTASRMHSSQPWDTTQSVRVACQRLAEKRS